MKICRNLGKIQVKYKEDLFFKLQLTAAGVFVFGLMLVSHTCWDTPS